VGDGREQRLAHHAPPDQLPWRRQRLCHLHQAYLCRGLRFASVAVLLLLLAQVGLHWGRPLALLGQWVLEPGLEGRPKA